MRFNGRHVEAQLLRLGNHGRTAKNDRSGCNECVIHIVYGRVARRSAWAIIRPRGSGRNQRRSSGLLAAFGACAIILTVTALPIATQTTTYLVPPLAMTVYNGGAPIPYIVRSAPAGTVNARSVTSDD